MLVWGYILPCLTPLLSLSSDDIKVPHLTWAETFYSVTFVDPKMLLHVLMFCFVCCIMVSLCGVCVHGRILVNDFSKTTRPRDMLLILKDTLST